MLDDEAQPLLAVVQRSGVRHFGCQPVFDADADTAQPSAPLNTHGGQLGEAYIHGMNGIAEGVRQVRGTSVNQVPRVEHVLVTAGTMVPTSALIVGVDN